MRPLTIVIYVVFGIALGVLGMQFWPKAESAAPLPVSVPVVEAPAAVVKPKEVVKAKPTPPIENKRPEVSEEMKARFKVFGEETRQMALDIAGGDEKKLGNAIRAGMFTAEGIEVMRRAREMGENFKKATTDEEREALLGQVPALREQAFAQLRMEVAKLDGAVPAAGTPAPVAPPVPLM